MRGELRRRSDVPLSVREDMYRLLRGQFEGVGPEQFEADLAEKGWVVLLRSDPAGPLRGFSTLDVYRRSFDGEETGVVYSGDTVVDGGSGMGSSLSKIWIGAVNAIRAEMGLDRLVWLLLTSGYRTYRFLPMYWREFHPRHDRPWPADALRLMETLAGERFGEQYDRDARIVRFSRPQVLRPHLHGIPSGRLGDPHIAFFARANPGHEAGDELVCLTELCASNLTAAGRRMWRAGERFFPPAGRSGA